MLKPGWKRELCPQCRQSGRVWQRYTDALIKAGKVERAVDSVFIRITLDALETELHADICDCCGVQYVYEAVKYKVRKGE